MHHKMVFLGFIVLSAITLPAVVGGAALLLGRLIGMGNEAILLLIGSAVVATFTGVLALAGLAAALLFPK